MSTDLIEISTSLANEMPTKLSSPNLEISASESLIDCEWDDFVAATPGGHHVQTTMWSRLKAAHGWSTTRVIARKYGCIVCGAQMLTRQCALGLRVGYVPKGPVGRDLNQDTTTAFVSALKDEARKQKLNCLIVHPTEKSAMTATMRDRDFNPVRLASLMQATTAVDLRQEMDAITKTLRPKTRNRLRHAIKEGLHVRRGTANDIDTFHSLLMATAARQGFDDFSKEYFQNLWQEFAPSGNVQLFFAEYEGKTVATLLCLAYSQTAHCKKRGWSGECGKLLPNEILELAAIEWAKAAGYWYYDFDGISLSAAQSALRGDSLPQDKVESAASYKLKFGGSVEIFPEPLFYFPNPLARWACRHVYTKVAGWRIFGRVANRIKVG